MFQGSVGNLGTLDFARISAAFFRPISSEAQGLGLAESPLEKANRGEVVRGEFHLMFDFN